MKDWPRYLTERRLANGAISYYWTPRAADRKAGFPGRCEPLGGDLAEASGRARDLNRALDAWRQGRGGERSLDLEARFGTLDWLLESFQRTPAFLLLSERVKPDYRRFCRLVGDVATEFGDSEVTEAQFMAASGHATPAAARLYVKATDAQRLAAARRRRAWLIERESEKAAEEAANMAPNENKSAS